MSKEIITDTGGDIATHDGTTTDLVLNPEHMDRMLNLANIMASGAATVPRHLQGNQADCMAVIMQSAQWNMNPFAVAQKTHLVNGTLGYEAQLVHAVVSSSSAIVGHFAYDYFGPWENVIGKFTVAKNQNGKEYHKPAWGLKDEAGIGVRIWATLRGNDEPSVLTLLLSQAQVRNSTLWASDPKQQLTYLAIKRWTRIFAPAVILGVYTPDELHQVKDINPAPAKRRRPTGNAAAALTGKAQVVEPDGADGPDGEAIDPVLLDWQSAISAASTLNELLGIGEQIGKAKLTDEQKAQLKRDYKKREQDL